MNGSTEAARNRRSFTRTDLIVLVCAALLFAALLAPSMDQVRSYSRGAICSDNLLHIGQAMHVYANDNDQWFPIHYYRRDHWAAGPPAEHDIRWVGMMGSTDELRITEETSPSVSPKASHPSRSLFLLVTRRWDVEPTFIERFICPSTRDVTDDLWNYGDHEPAVPGVNRFDFRGYNHLSYSYQLPYGRRGLPRETMHPGVAVSADKGPYYQGELREISATPTIHDQRSAVDAPRQWVDLSIDEILTLPPEEWAPYNSRNHGGTGQNVLYVDGSVSFRNKPIFGYGADNIYTVHNSFTDLRESMIGVMPDADEYWGPLLQTDSFLVP